MLAQRLVADRRPALARRRLSSAARRSGVSRVAGLRSRASTGCRTSGGAPVEHSRDAPAPAERTRSSGSCPSGSSAKRSVLPGPMQGQREIDGAVGGAAAGLVAVEAQDRLVGHPPQQARAAPAVSAVPSGATALGKPADAHGDHVDIALDGDDRPPVMRGLAGVVVVVEAARPCGRAASPGEFRYLAGDVLLQRPAAEGDDPAAHVADREHHAVAEAVIGTGDRPRRCTSRPASIIGLAVDALAGEVVAQRIAVGGRIAEAGTRPAIVGVRPAAGEIAARLSARAACSSALEEARRPAPSRRCRLARCLLALLGLAASTSGSARRPCRRAARTASGKGTPSVSITKAKMSPCLPEEKSWIEALLVVDEEGRRLLGVEGRQPLPFPPRLVQPHPLADDLRHRQPGADLVEEAGRIAHGCCVAEIATKGRAFPAIHRRREAVRGGALSPARSGSRDPEQNVRRRPVVRGGELGAPRGVGVLQFAPAQHQQRLRRGPGRARAFRA